MPIKQSAAALTSTAQAAHRRMLPLRAGVNATSVRVAELNGQPLTSPAASAPAMSDLPVAQRPAAPAPLTLPVLPAAPIAEDQAPIPIDNGRLRVRAILMKARPRAAVSGSISLCWPMPAWWVRDAHAWTQLSVDRDLCSCV